MLELLLWFKLSWNWSTQMTITHTKILELEWRDPSVNISAWLALKNVILWEFLSIFLEETSKLTTSESCPKLSERVPLRRLQARSRSTRFSSWPNQFGNVPYNWLDGNAKYFRLDSGLLEKAVFFFFSFYFYLIYHLTQF